MKGKGAGVGGSEGEGIRVDSDLAVGRRRWSLQGGEAVAEPRPCGVEKLRRPREWSGEQEGGGGLGDRGAEGLEW